ncbi:MAG: rhodanese-like domain-containing protein [Candidatus Omnitrophica bacterium]|nr:rhodanese-like domain-containing protein [Candidatus Omnitrophota bacterium]
MTNRLKFLAAKLIIKIMIVGLVGGIIFSGCAKSSQNYSKNEKQEIISQMYAQYKQGLFPDIADIRINDLKKFSKSDLLYVDIRDKAEQDVSMLPGAITQQQFESHQEQYKNKTIIAYCTIGNRSGRYIKNLNLPDLEVYNLIGGILAWAWANNELVDSNGLTKRVHVYGPKWNLLPDDYLSVY